MDQVISQATSERNAVIVALAVSGGGDDVELPTVDEAVMRLDDALISDDEAPEHVDPERVALRRALNLPDVPEAMRGRR